MADEARSTEPMPLGAKLWVAGLVVMLLLAASVLAAASRMPRSLAMTSVAGIERLTGIELPQNTEIVEARYSAPAASQGRFAWAMLRMPREEAISLLQSERFKDTFERGERIVEGRSKPGFGDHFEVWRPEAAQSVASASTPLDLASETWNVLAQADLDDPEVATVYLVMTR